MQTFYEKEFPTPYDILNSKIVKHLMSLRMNYQNRTYGISRYSIVCTKL